MKKYLLDTNICAYFLNGKYDLVNTIDKIGFENCAVSKMTKDEIVEYFKKRNLETAIKPCA